MIKENKIEKVVEEYQKIFVNSFPKSIDKDIVDFENYNKAPNEEFIENLFSVSINSNIEINIVKYCTPNKGGWRKTLLEKIPLNWIRKEDDLEFKANLKNIQGEFSTRWKVRNFGAEAEKKDFLRGQILNDSGGKNIHKDKAAFFGKHFLECYIIQNNVCIARKKVTVPI